MKRKYTLMLLTGVVMLSFLGKGEVFAADTKHAILNEARIRFNEGSVQTIQCYNIDGSNYVRAREITNRLDMELYEIKNGNKGVMIDTRNKPEKKSSPERLTQKSADIHLEDGWLIYDGTPHKVQCFLLNGRYYFKLADFEKSSDYCLEVSTDLVRIEAEANIVENPFIDEFSGISVEWDAEARVIDIRNTKTDMNKVFDEIRENGRTKDNGKEIKPNQNVRETEAGADEEKTKAKGKLVSAPKEGDILAKILIDSKMGAYLMDGSVNWDNLEEAYTYTTEQNFGQCTWYAKGRFIETTGIDIRKNPFSNSNTYLGWVTNAQSDKCPDLEGTTDPEEIEAGCIAMYDGHALFVEWVEYDKKGHPEMVYFTEANSGHRTANKEPGVYYPDFDCKVQCLGYDTFINGRNSDFIGYVKHKN